MNAQRTQGDAPSNLRAGLCECNTGFEFPDGGGTEGQDCIPTFECGTGTMLNEAGDGCVCEDGYLDLDTSQLIQTCRLPVNIDDCDTVDPDAQYFDDGGTPSDASDDTCRKPTTNAECRMIDAGLMPPRTGAGAQPIATTAAGEPDGCRPVQTDEDCQAEIESPNMNFVHPNEGTDIAASDCRFPNDIGECLRALPAGDNFYDSAITDNNYKCRPVRSSAECGDLIAAGGTVAGNNYYDPNTAVCTRPTMNAHCSNVYGNAQPIYDADSDTCRPPENIADCDMLNPNEQYFDDGGTPSDTSDDTCRKPDKDSECRAIDAGLTSPRTGTNAQPIATDAASEPDGCRARISDDCSTDALPYFDTTDNECKVYPNMDACPTAADNYLPIYDDDAAATGDCRLPESIAECHSLKPNEQFFDDGGTTSDTSDDTCRKPTTNAECRMIDEGLTPPRTGATAQPIATTDSGEPDGCRPVQTDADCQMEINNADMRFVHPNRGTDIAASACRFPNDIGECERALPVEHDFYDSTITDNYKCRPRENSDTVCTAPEINKNGVCVKPQDRADCATLYPDNSQPIHDTREPDNCRPPENIADCDSLNMNAQYFDTGTNTCRKPDKDSECKAIDAGLTSPRTGTDAQPIATTAAGEPDGCRPPESIAECDSVNPNAQYYDTGTNACRQPADHGECGEINDAISTGERVFSDSEPDNCRPLRDDGSDCAIISPENPFYDGTTCRKPMNNAECRGVDARMPYFDNTLTDAVQCREYRDGECPTAADNYLPIYDDDAATTGDCRLPRDSRECDMADNTRPVYDTAITAADKCRARNDDSDCPAGMVLGTDGTCDFPVDDPECRRLDSTKPIFDDSAEAGLSDPKCRARIADDCAATGEIFSGGNCIAPSVFLETGGIMITTAGETYTATECTGAEWTATIEISDDNLNAAEVCLIPVRRDNAVSIIVQNALRGDLQPQLANNATAAGCLMRVSGTFAANDYANIGANTELCNDAQLFGAGGFPDKPAGFDETRSGGGDQIIISGTEILARVNGDIVPVIRFASQGQRPAVFGGGDSKPAYPIIGGVMGVLLLVAAWENGGFSQFAFSPEWNHALDESGYYAKAGGRMDFRKDRWHLYYSADQTNRDGDFGDFRYTSGGEYEADIWRATFSETIAGEKADYDFALSANFGNENGIWNVKPTYRIHSRFDENDSGILESETRNSLNLEAALEWNRWKIKPSAGFSWQNERDFGDNAKFRLNAVHRF